MNAPAAPAAPTKAPAPKAEKAPKAPAEKKEPTVKRSKFEAMYPDDAKLTVLADKNPKKVGSKSAERFEGYTGAATIGAARQAGVTYQDLAYDVGRQFIKIG